MIHPQLLADQGTDLSVLALVEKLIITRRR